MYSVKFPDMLASSKVNLASDHVATWQNLVLMLKSDRTSLFGDPYYGTILKKLLYNQNNIILQDLVIDELYTSILTFMPQIKLARSDIKLTIENDTIYANITCVNLIDYQLNTYSIKLTEDDEA